MEINKIICGDALTELKNLPADSIDCIITSPPYYGLRDYKINGQIGLESTFELYLDHLLEITGELKRVLKKTGTMWWNHGDSYGGSGKGRGNKTPGKNLPYEECHPEKTEGMEKSLMLQNFRLIQKMIDEQKWILRNIIIWHKPNCMPSSVKDRFTVDYEPVFFLTKSKKYWFESQYEPHESSGGYKPFNKRVRDVIAGRVASHQYKASKEEMLKWQKNEDSIHGENAYNPLGRNKRSVWDITTKPFKDAHFATFPEDLITPMILAGCPEGGVILDPFIGSGTTGVVAKKLGRNYLGIELNPKYVKMAEERIRGQCDPLF